MSEAVAESSWILSGIISPTSSMIVHLVSLFCLGMGIILSGPFIFLIILDIFIWIWRQCRKQTLPPNTNHVAHAASPPPSPTRRRSRDEKANHSSLNEKI